MGMSIRAYARHRGVAHNAVRKAIQAGRIQREKDGTIEVTQADADWEKNTNPLKRSNGIATRDEVTSDEVTSDGATRGRAMSSRVSGTTNGLVQARTAHEIAKAHLARQRLQEKKGELISKDLVKAQVFRFGRQIRDAWMTWPSRVSAQMAAELQVDEHVLHMVLASYVREHLNELGESKLNIE